MDRLLIHLTEFLALGALGLAMIPASAAGGAAASPEFTTTSTEHVNYATAKSFDEVTAGLEKQLGKFDPTIYQASARHKPDPTKIEAQSRATEGTSGLMIFAKYEHGGLLALRGKKAAATQYVIGNPLVALEMTQVDIRAGEYAPLRLLVYTGEDGKTHVDYDLPSSVFGRFQSQAIDAVAKGLDEKLERLVKNALQ